LIRLDEVHKFTKYEAPFGVACGHNQWSREGKKLAELSSTSESRAIVTTGSIKTLHHKNRDMQDHDEIYDRQIIKDLDR
jgi:hypothetical protein